MKIIKISNGVKKILIFSLLLFTRTAYAQEVTTAEVPPFWQDKTFLLLAGGAIFLIILLIVKKALDKKRMNSNSDTADSSQNYEDSNL